MSRTFVLGYADLATAQQKASGYSADHKVMIIGPTDQAQVENDGHNGAVWRSGPNADLYLLIATKDSIVGPQPAAGDG